MVRFSLLSALSTQNDPPQAASKPFSKNRDGFVMAEGAGTLVLESYDAAIARGAKILGVVAGCGELTDSFHRTRSAPDGKPAIGCVLKTLADAGMAPEQIDHINAHGTSTPENDKMEYLATNAVFGEHTAKIPVTSNKSAVGHTISAAGAVEAIFSLLTLEHQRIPPTLNYENPDPGDSLRRRRQQGARCPRHRGDVELVRFRRAECLADPDARTGLSVPAAAAAMNRLLLRIRARLRDALKPVGEAAVGGVTIALLRTTRLFDPDKTANFFGRALRISSAAACARTASAAKT